MFLICSLNADGFLMTLKLNINTWTKKLRVVNLIKVLEYYLLKMIFTQSNYNTNIYVFNFKCKLFMILLFFLYNCGIIY